MQCCCKADMILCQLLHRHIIVVLCSETGPILNMFSCDIGDGEARVLNKTEKGVLSATLMAQIGIEVSNMHSVLSLPDGYLRGFVPRMQGSDELEDSGKYRDSGLLCPDGKSPGMYLVLDGRLQSHTQSANLLSIFIHGTSHHRDDHAMEVTTGKLFSY